MNEPPALDVRWLQAKSLGMLTRVETLKKGQRFIDCYGAWLTYEKVDGAGPGATHHARAEETALGWKRRYLAGWCEVLVWEPCPNHAHIVGWPWEACPVCVNST